MSLRLRTLLILLLLPATAAFAAVRKPAWDAPAQLAVPKPTAEDRPVNPLGPSVDPNLPALFQIAPSLDDDSVSDFKEGEKERLFQAIDAAIDKQMQRPTDGLDRDSLQDLRNWLADTEDSKGLVNFQLFQRISNSNVNGAIVTLFWTMYAYDAGKAETEDVFDQDARAFTKWVTRGYADCGATRKLRRTICQYSKEIVGGLAGTVVTAAIGGTVYAIITKPVQAATGSFIDPSTQIIDTLQARYRFPQWLRVKMQTWAASIQTSPDSEDAAYMTALPGKSPKVWHEFFKRIAMLGQLQENKNNMTLQLATWQLLELHLNPIEHHLERAWQVMSFATARNSAYATWTIASLQMERAGIPVGEINRAIALSETMFKLRLKNQVGSTEFSDASKEFDALVAGWKAGRTAGVDPEARSQADVDADARLRADIDAFEDALSIEEDAKLNEILAVVYRVHVAIYEASINRGVIDQTAARTESVEEWSGFFSEMKRDQPELQEIFTAWNVPIDIGAFLDTRGKGGLVNYMADSLRGKDEPAAEEEDSGPSLLARIRGMAGCTARWLKSAIGGGSGE